MSTRKQLVLLGVWAMFCAAFVGVVWVATRPQPPVASRGVLVQAVLNGKSGSGVPAARIALDPAHLAVVGTDKVTWWDQAGGEHQTPVGDRSNILGMFDTYNYTNLREETGVPLSTIVLAVGPTLLVIIIIVALFWRQGSFGAMKMLRARPNGLAGDRPQTRFSDVAGCDEAKAELHEVVEFLSDPGRYRDLGARVPKGVLLIGPPGTGKTLLSRAVAGEAHCAFLAVSGSEFVEMFVGVGAARVRDLFKQAKKMPPCIVFIDEIDAVGRRRGEAGWNHGQEEREQTLNQLLVEMDGFSQDSRIVVIAATNRPDVLDEALLRPGRFDRRVMVEAPDVRGREAILQLHSQGKPLDADADLQVMARRTPGFTGADLANLVNEAALLAGRDGSRLISLHHLEESIDRTLAGPARTGRILTDGERRIIAYHEIGHALVLASLPGTDPIHKVSIIGRGRSLGWTLTLPADDRVLGSKAQLANRLAGMVGGRAAEEILLGADDITTGGADDFLRATELARQMVAEFGMSPLGIRVVDGGRPSHLRGHSEDLSRLVDMEVNRLLDDALTRARQILTQRRALLDDLAAHLLEVETMTAAEMAEVMDNHATVEVPGLVAFPIRATVRPAAVTATPLVAVGAAAAAPRSRSENVRQALRAVSAALRRPRPGL